MKIRIQTISAYKLRNILFMEINVHNTLEKQVETLLINSFKQTRSKVSLKFTSIYVVAGQCHC